jgi:hypothetical protein
VYDVCSPHAVVHKATVKETGFEIASKILLMRGEGDTSTTSVYALSPLILLSRETRVTLARSGW